MSKKTALEHFQDIKELEVADGTEVKVEDINDMNILLEAPMIKVVDLLPYKCEQVEKSLKALEIIKEKRVDLPYLRCCIEDNQSVYRYNEYIRNKTMDYDHEEELTKEDFETIKEALDSE